MKRMQSGICLIFCHGLMACLVTSMWTGKCFCFPVMTRCHDRGMTEYSDPLLIVMQGHCNNQPTQGGTGAGAGPCRGRTLYLESICCELYLQTEPSLACYPCLV